MKTIDEEAWPYAPGQHSAQVLLFAHADHKEEPSHRRNLHEGKVSPLKMTSNILASPTDVLVGVCGVLTISGIIPALLVGFVDVLCSALGDWVILPLLAVVFAALRRVIANG